MYIYIYMYVNAHIRIDMIMINMLTEIYVCSERELPCIPSSTGPQKSRRSIRF